MIDILKAMDDTLALAREHNLDNVESDLPYGDYPHLLNMRERANEINDREKLNRFLGWMQASVYNQALGDITLEDLKEINRVASRAL